jgi:vacuolar-type H+-ATPase subunit D/Vma8
MVEPEIEKEIGVITDYLEEMSREEIFRMKRYKALKLRRG